MSMVDNVNDVEAGASTKKSEDGVRETLEGIVLSIRNTVPSAPVSPRTDRFDGTEYRFTMEQAKEARDVLDNAIGRAEGLFAAGYYLNSPSPVSDEAAKKIALEMIFGQPVADKLQEAMESTRLYGRYFESPLEIDPSADMIIDLRRLPLDIKKRVLELLADGKRLGQSRGVVTQTRADLETWAKETGVVLPGGASQESQEPKRAIGSDSDSCFRTP